MKRLALLLASTAMPLALFAAPDLTSRAAAQAPPPSVEMMLEEAGLDAQALERLESTLAETQEEARALRERADELADRAATSTAQAADARAAFEALADDSDADPDAIAAARADAEDAAAQAAEDAQSASQAREAAAEAEAEISAIRERLETARREVQEIRDREAEAEAEAERAAAEAAEREAEAAAEAEREAETAEEAERKAAAEREAEADSAAEAKTETETGAEAEARRKAEAEREVQSEREAEAEADADAEVDAEVEVESEAELAGEAEAQQETEPVTEADAESERQIRGEAAPATGSENEGSEPRPESDAAETTREPVPSEERTEEPQDFGDVREGRRERTEDGVTITEEAGARTIIQQGSEIILRQAEDERVRRTYSNVRRERRGEQDVLIAPREGNVEIITILDTDGNLLRRIRREADGTETVLIDNTREVRADRERGGDRWRDRRGDRRDGRQDDTRFGYEGSAFSFRIEIAPPVVDIPRDRYIVDYGDLREDDLAEIFSAPPVSEIRERYTLDEVRYNPNLRDYMARVDLDTVTFDTGSWRLNRAQIDQLERVADAMNDVIDRNPDEIFLIEGHTDAIGRAIDNLSLSDRRAESVAFMLSQFYDVPPENLVTQGYGEEYLKIDTQAAERGNRRVTIRRITPLITQGPRG